MPTGLLIGVLLGYFPGMFIVLRLIAMMQKKLVVNRAAMKAPKTRTAQQNLPKPVWPTWMERVRFTLKDTRPSKFGMPNKQLFLMIILAGLVIALAGVFVKWWIIAIGYSMFFVAIIYAVISAKDILETRKKILDNMFIIGSSKGVISNEYADNPNAVIKVLNWDDFIKPTKVEYQVRTEFSDSGEEGFMQAFNQKFGTETAWVPSDDPETGTPGWNYDKGVLTIHAVPPLPTMAPWSEHYVLDPGVAWSFFPIGLGVENGLEIPNPNTGVVENVLGFDVSGEAGKYAKKAGYKMSEKIVTSPMILCAGATGGGKALSTDTIVNILATNTQLNASDAETGCG